MNGAPLTFADVMTQTLLNELPQIITFFLRGLFALVLAALCFLMIYVMDRTWLKGVKLDEELKGRPYAYVLLIAFIFYLVIHR